MNRQLWNLYKESDRGKKCIDMFNPEIENTYDGIKTILDFLGKWEDKTAGKGWLELNFLFAANLPASGLLPEDGNWTREKFKRLVEEYQLIEAAVDEDGKVNFTTMPNLCFCPWTNIVKKRHSLLLCRFSCSILTHSSSPFCYRHVLM